MRKTSRSDYFLENRKIKKDNVKSKDEWSMKERDEWNKEKGRKKWGKKEIYTQPEIKRK
jgi:hypothetical protein